jgi:excisionase family DNA binding protein
METPLENHEEPLCFLTLKEAADVLQLSVRIVLRIVKRKELPAFRVGGRGQWRVSQRQLTKWMQGFQSFKIERSCGYEVC